MTYEDRDREIHDRFALQWVCGGWIDCVRFMEIQYRDLRTVSEFAAIDFQVEALVMHCQHAIPHALYASGWHCAVQYKDIVLHNTTIDSFFETNVPVYPCHCWICGREFLVHSLVRTPEGGFAICSPTCRQEHARRFARRFGTPRSIIHESIDLRGMMDYLHQLPAWSFYAEEKSTTPFREWQKGISF